MASEPDLLGLLSDIEIEARFQFTDRGSLARSLRSFFDSALTRDSLSDHTALVTNFPPKSFVIDEDDYNTVDKDNYNAVYDIPCILRHHKVLYITESKLLYLTMPSTVHELASTHFSHLLYSKIGRMHCIGEIIPTGGAIREMKHEMGTVSKGPDGSWGPSETGYTTCVLETGMSESRSSLGWDAKIWLQNNDSHVNICITIKIHPNRPELVFVIWKRVVEDLHTRAKKRSQAVKDQEILVRLDAGRPIVNRRLSIPFKSIAERRPRPGTKERDLVFSTRELAGLARMVWKELNYPVLP